MNHQPRKADWIDMASVIVQYPGHATEYHVDPERLTEYIAEWEAAGGRIVSVGGRSYQRGR